MAKWNCIVGDPFCGTFGDPCEHCLEEMAHRRRVELARARNEGMLAERDRRAQMYEDVDPTAAAIGLAVVGVGFGIAKLANHIKEKRAEKKAAAQRGARR